jgi:hypothetical protein
LGELHPLVAVAGELEAVVRQGREGDAEGGRAGERFDDLPRVVGRAVVGDDEFERAVDALLPSDRLEHEREVPRLLESVDDQ